MAELAMSVREAARALGLGRETVYEMVRQNQIPSVKVGRRVIIPRPALEAWLAGAAKPEDTAREETAAGTLPRVTQAAERTQGRTAVRGRGR